LPSALAARSDPARGFLRHGLAWALGHSLSMLLLALVVLLAGHSLPADWDRALHIVVGVLLLLLGVAALRRGLWPPPANAAPAAEAATAPVAEPARWRSLLIGFIQGLAGTGALMLLAIDTTGRPAYALGYVGVFAAGSIVGMALVAMLLSVPLARAARRLRPGLPIVYASGRVTEPDPRRALPDAPFRAKPFSVAAALNALNGAMGRG
jgi:hypothetical protein